MEGKKIRAIGTSLILCLAAMNISGCGSKDSESSTNAVMGRVTSISDTQIVMEVMDKQDDKKPEAASGGAAGIEGNKPQGTPPAGMQQDNDGKKPEGTPPADAKDGGKKKWSKGKLAKQSIVCLRNNGNIKNINLIHLNNKQNTDEIKDIRCNGTSIAITYQYGNVTIYNLLERLAFGGSSISGMPGENIFYDLHYLTIETKKTTEEIYLRDYDIRSGEVTHTFPLGSFAQKKEDFHITNLGNTLYVLTPRGLFRGECESSSLQKLLAFRELQLPPQTNILTMFSGSADSLYLVIKEADGSKSIRLIHLPSQNLSDQNHPESNHATQKV